MSQLLHHCFFAIVLRNRLTAVVQLLLQNCEVTEVQHAHPCQHFCIANAPLCCTKSPIHVTAISSLLGATVLSISFHNCTAIALQLLHHVRNSKHIHDTVFCKIATVPLLGEAAPSMCHCYLVTFIAPCEGQQAHPCCNYGGVILVPLRPAMSSLPHPYLHC